MDGEEQGRRFVAIGDRILFSRAGVKIAFDLVGSCEGSSAT